MPPKHDVEGELTMFKRAVITVLVGGMLSFGVYMQQSVAGIRIQLGVMEEKMTAIAKIAGKLDVVYDRQLRMKAVLDGHLKTTKNLGEEDLDE